VKRSEHIAEAAAIGADSFALLNFGQLPRRASRAAQIEALWADQRWQENHHGDISRRIDGLIRLIERAEVGE